MLQLLYFLRSMTSPLLKIVTPSLMDASDERCTGP